MIAKIIYNEKISDEELEIVSGGSYGEMLSDDSCFLNVLLGGNVIDRFGSWRAKYNTEKFKVLGQKSA